MEDMFMEKSKVYFTDFRTRVGVSLTEKLQRLIKKAGITDIDMDGKFVAIKMHFGELGNLSYLRPNYAKAVADVVKECGGKPFLTDCNTLYPGSRKNALEHLDCANINGFNTITTGCQIIIGDGLRGTDDITVPVRNGEYCKEAYIGRAVMDADIFISLTHFKGHESTGFGGTIKNIGMGCGSRAGKMHQHNSGKPIVHDDLCRGCRRCAKECGSDAITYENGKAVINQDICKGCGRCIGACAFDAIENQNWNANEILGRKMAEYSQAVCDGRPTFHISLVRDISPNCDCHGENDAPILPDVGIFASFDPVALDQACVDACLHATPMPNSQLSDNLADPHWHHHHDNFLDSNPNVRWKETLEHAEKIGLGTREYELIQMK
ncbi:4Fe-4S binding domain protein [Catenibacterium mitsuokai DSM 15897]|nr:4Fe-4S binding domain protein [Catenibacterium mitsuokai DSM 15897]